MKPIHFALAALDNAYILASKNCCEDNKVDMQICKAKIYSMAAKGAFPVSCHEIDEGCGIEIEFESNENGEEGSLCFYCPESIEIAQEFYDVYCIIEESNVCLAL